MSLSFGTVPPRQEVQEDRHVPLLLHNSAAHYVPVVGEQADVEEREHRPRDRPEVLVVVVSLHVCPVPTR